MLLMLWAGERVIYNSVRQPNILWSLERWRAVLVDFERAEVLNESERQGLRQISVES